ncbi:MAG: HlyD family efflux transporter periplasmic adaptor subunit [Verrucomicrobiae bacterium]|nr:HlyD family efflux transporter periplasmic adaptor subunit [Verrucomicrobiae bacterium]
MAVSGYKQGIVFDRMNGVVGVDQASIAPTEDGTFLGLAPKIKTGQSVVPGQLIGEMDPTMIELEILKFKEKRRLSGMGNVIKNHEKLVELQSDQLEAEEKLALTESELNSLIKQREALENSSSKLITPAHIEKLELDIRVMTIKRDSDAALNAFLKESVTKRTELLENEISKDDQETIHYDPDDEQQLAMMDLRLERTKLKAVRPGIVDRILKDPGEFVKAGEPIAKVVTTADHIIGFLPQQELASVKVDDEVWITSAIDRVTTFKSKVRNLSPRIDSVRDSASPLPNQAVRGRTILIDFPEDAKSAFLPGQPVIIHLKPPGELSLMTKFFNLFRK